MKRKNEEALSYPVKRFEKDAMFMRTSGSYPDRSTVGQVGSHVLQPPLQFTSRDCTRIAALLAQIAAATPIACPVMKHPGMTRIELCMYRSALMQRPATRTFVSWRGTRQRYGMP